MTSSVRCRFDDVGPLGTQSSELDGLIDVIEARSLSEISGVLDRADKAARQGLIAAGFVTYDAAPAFDSALTVTPQQSRVDQGLPLAWFGIFTSSRHVAALCDSPAPWTQKSSPHSEDEPLWSPDIDPSGHGEAIGHLREAIAAGETYLTNFTTRFRRPWPAEDDPFVLYQRLVSTYSSGLHTYIETENWAVASGSPELFFDLRGRSLTVQPMKGTTPRGRWNDEDLRAAANLRSSLKERAENVMVVDLVRNDLGRIAVSGSVEVPELCAVERHPTLWHLTSTVTATAQPDASLNDIFGALFPCASVTGAPKVSTMRLIAELENSRRGLYCGAVGFVRPSAAGSSSSDLEARFSVAIRTAVVDKEANVAEYGSGGGITWDSCPDAEWNELLLKAKVLASDAGTPGLPSALLETMRFDPSQRSEGKSGIRNLDLHLQRLRSSADFFDWPYPEGLTETLERNLEGDKPARVRLLLSRDGSATVESHPLPGQPESQATFTLCIDHEPVEPSDHGLFHKTTDRRRYDVRKSRHQGVDDVVLINTRGEVTETARANLAVRIGTTWFTPPIECGLLPGVERRRLIESGVLHERVITVTEFEVADEVATMSSLRGWNAATIKICSSCTTEDDQA